MVEIIGIEGTRLVYLIIAAFAGGAFGASLGALNAFAFTGWMVIAGEAINILKSELVELEAIAGIPGLGVTGLLGFGPVFGPHISFAGGAAAAAYAAKKGYMDTDFPYHEGKNIPYALGCKPDVLAVGGLFGIFGLLLMRSFAFVSAPWDPIALTVVLSAILHRVVFGYDIVGDVAGKGVFDVTPFEREEMRSADSGEVAADGGTSDRLATEVWLGHQYKWGEVAMIGVVAGILGAFIAIETGSPFLGFGISAASLTFLSVGIAQIPVTHHITLPASTGALAVFAAWGLIPAIVVGTVFGIIGALSGEVIERIFYAHGDTHVDPPAAAIAFCTFVIAVLAIAGVFPSSSWVPLPV